ncbi:MAG: hypothetical protein AUH31_03595 [Armatimonadetes bacterium 13_1_40CM_64_14]|nr:MAG: hypothetical protein AUH31_03595 [Armatimonadetes bacterium 13_1_40CM_64_14]
MAWLVAGVASASEVSLQVQAGWSGWIPRGAWVPVRVELLSTDAVDGMIVIDVATRDPSGPMSFRHPVRLVRGVRQRVTLEVIVPEVRRALLVRVVVQGRDVAREEIPLSLRSAVDGVILVLTREAAGLESLFDLSRILRPAYITEAELPVHWQGYAGVALLVIHDLDPEAVAPEQREALAQWVAQGGRLVVSGGDSLMRLRDSWLGQMLPAEPIGLYRLDPSRELPGVRGPILATALSPRSGAIMQGRLRAQGQSGAGAVTVWAVDLLAPDLRTWAGQGALWEAELNTPVPSWLVTRDLRDVLAASRPFPVSIQVWFAVLALVYLSIARFALLRASRIRFGWVPVLAVTLVSVPTMYGFGLQARRVGTVAIQTSVVEGIGGADAARVRSIIALLSPYGGAFDFTAPAGARAQPIEPHALTFDSPAAIRGPAPPSGLQLEVLQLTPMPVRGRLRESPDGQRVDITPRGGVRIEEPVLVRRGQIYRLPPITTALSISLDPARWETFAAPPNAPPALDDRLMGLVLARIAGRPRGSGASAWLVGRINSPELSLRSRSTSVEVHQVVAVPLLGEEGRP